MDVSGLSPVYPLTLEPPLRVNVRKAEVKCIIWENINKRWLERRKGDSYTTLREMLKRIGWEVGIGEKRRGCADEVTVGTVFAE